MITPKQKNVETKCKYQVPETEEKMKYQVAKTKEKMKYQILQKRKAKYHSKNFFWSWIRKSYVWE